MIMFEKSFPFFPWVGFWMSVLLCTTIIMPKLYAGKCSKGPFTTFNLVSSNTHFLHNSYIFRTLGNFKSNLNTMEPEIIMVVIFSGYVSRKCNVYWSQFTQFFLQINNLIPKSALSWCQRVGSAWLGWADADIDI